MYYEETFTCEGLEGYYFRINKIKPTKLFAYQTLLAQVFGESNKNNDEVQLEKCCDFILENMEFSREKDGNYIPIQYPGLLNTNIPELERNPNLISYLISLFLTQVTNPIQKN